ncbi:hypothetical protein NE237_014310 [Protea cynaroides]|uniref:Uncharacterized protein n=1 Tax=Protea cynaroides TaxID=273540 RepID=A0A9Q0GPC5_9MAGN|nr:hypothetical protein NE237_014310 [Protea cynaroides]
MKLYLIGVISREAKLAVQGIEVLCEVSDCFLLVESVRNGEGYFSARFHVKSVLKLQGALLTSYHRNEVKFTEITLYTFRMLQCLEWEPSGSFYEKRPVESTNNGAIDESGASGLIDINLAMDMTDPTLPPNPRKTVLYRASATHLISVLATLCEVLPREIVLLVYISASGKAGQSPQMGSLKGSRIPSNKKVVSQSSHGHYNSQLGAPNHEKGDSSDYFGNSLWLGPRGSGGLNNFYPGDIIPFTRLPLFLIIDSDNSHAFKAGLSNLVFNLLDYFDYFSLKFYKERKRGGGGKEALYYNGHA